MKTSYFAKSGRNVDAVAIIAKRPWFYKGKIYSKLAPLNWFLKKYKKDGDDAYYIKQYYRAILDKLDPKEVYEELGEDAILICWEGKGKFCHRHIVADWLEAHLGIEVKEL